MTFDRPHDMRRLLRTYEARFAEVPVPDAIARAPAAMFQRSSKQGDALFQWACRMGVAAANCFWRPACRAASP